MSYSTMSLFEELVFDKNFQRSVIIDNVPFIKVSCTFRTALPSQGMKIELYLESPDMIRYLDTLPDWYIYVAVERNLNSVTNFSIPPKGGPVFLIVII